MTIDLSPELEKLVREEIRAGGFSSVHEYLLELILNEQRRKAGERLDDLIQESIDSGPLEPVTPEDWNVLRERLRERFSGKS